MIFDTTRHDPVASGGEGDIYDYNGEMIKIFKNPDVLDDKKKKLTWLAKNGKFLPTNICLPLRMVEDSSGKFIGYSMPKIVGDDIQKLSSKKYCRVRGITNKNVSEIMSEIASTLNALHLLGVVVGDLNDGAIIIRTSDNMPVFIDCDSWSIPGTSPCTVGMEGFIDPELIPPIKFTPESDDFAFGVISWKGYTRIHPYGGTLAGHEKDKLTDRMRRSLSVISNRANIKFPPTTKFWDWMAPDMIETYKDTFEKRERGKLIKAHEEAPQLTYCDKCHDYFSSDYTSCPMCTTAKLKQKAPVNVGPKPGENIGMVSTPMFKEDEYLVILSLYLGIRQDGTVVDLTNPSRSFGKMTLDTVDLFLGEPIYYNDDTIRTPYGNLKKAWKQPVIVCGDSIYYYLGGIQKASVVNGKLYSGKLRDGLSGVPVYYNVYKVDTAETAACVTNILGKLHYEVYSSKTGVKSHLAPGIGKIVSYGIHYDYVKDSWLMIMCSLTERVSYYTTGKSGTFAQIDLDAIGLPEAVDPGNIEYVNGILYWPEDSKIVGYNLAKNVKKDFMCKDVNMSSKLVQNPKTKKFYIQNIDNIFVFG